MAESITAAASGDIGFAESGALEDNWILRAVIAPVPRSSTPATIVAASGGTIAVTDREPVAVPFNMSAVPLSRLSIAPVAESIRIQSDAPPVASVELRSAVSVTRCNRCAAAGTRIEIEPNAFGPVGGSVARNVTVAPFA